MSSILLPPSPFTRISAPFLPPSGAVSTLLSDLPVTHYNSDRDVEGHLTSFPLELQLQLSQAAKLTMTALLIAATDRGMRRADAWRSVCNSR